MCEGEPDTSQGLSSRASPVESPPVYDSGLRHSTPSPTTSVLRCGRVDASVSSVGKLPTIEEEDGLPDNTGMSSTASSFSKPKYEAPLDSREVFPSSVDDRRCSQWDHTASKSWPDVRGKSCGESFRQVLSSNAEHSSIFEIDSKTQKPVHFSRCPHIPRDHGDEVLTLASSELSKDDRPCIPEHGPDLVSGRVTVHDATFTARVRVHSGITARKVFGCLALLDTGSLLVIILCIRIVTILCVTVRSHYTP